MLRKDAAKKRRVKECMSGRMSVREYFDAAVATEDPVAIREAFIRLWSTAAQRLFGDTKDFENVP